jgi:HEAT repeat protein
MYETLDETLSALDDLIDEICDGEIEHDDDYFDPESSNELEARLKEIMERLIKEGDAAVDPLKGYLQDTRERASIIAVEVLREIGTPSAIWQLIDALESADSELRVRDRGTEDYQHTSDSVAGRENH